MVQPLTDYISLLINLKNLLELTYILTFSFLIYWSSAKSVFLLGLPWFDDL